MNESTEFTRILLDTNAFLYFIDNDAALSTTARFLLESEIDLVMSAASLWEIAWRQSTSHRRRRRSGDLSNELFYGFAPGRAG